MILSSCFSISLNTPIMKIRWRIGPSVAHASSSNGNPRIDTEQLRTQLDQLHAEAEIARSKANNARSRLMRLSESAQNLQRRAVTNVALGKENEARELLVQKKNLAQALERTKRRIEVLDELSLKINEAISMKETQLIGNVAFFSDISGEYSSQEIRIISPKNAVDEETQHTNIYDPQCTESSQEQDSEGFKTEKSLPIDHEKLINQGAVQIDDSMITLRTISSYIDFLEHVDQQLRQVESDLSNFLRLSAVILENSEEQMNSKVRQTSEILDNVRSIRGRIASFMKRRSNDN